MFVSFFEKSDILRFISTLLLLALLFWKSFFLTPPEEPLNALHFLFLTTSPTYNILLSTVLILMEGVLLFFISNQFKLIKNDSLLVMVSYLLLIGIFPALLYFPEFYFLQILFSLFITLCFYIPTRDFFLEILFWGSFLLGSLILIDSFFLLLILLISIYFIIIGQLNIRNLSILSIGTSLPYLLLSGYRFLFNPLYSPITFSWDSFYLQLDKHSDYVLWFILFFIILSATYKTYKKLSRHLTLQRHLFLFISLLSFTFLFFAFRKNSPIILYAIVPASFLVGRSLEHFQSKLWKDLYFIFLLLFGLSQNLLDLNFL